MKRVFVALLLALFLSFPAMAADKPKEGDGPVFYYVELDPLMLPVVDDEGISQVLNLVVSLEVPTLVIADKVKLMKPKLTDAFLMDLYGVLNKNEAMKNGVLQVYVVKKRLLGIARDVMGEDEKVNDVLLQIVQQKQV